MPYKKMYKLPCLCETPPHMKLLISEKVEHRQGMCSNMLQFISLL